MSWIQFDDQTLRHPKVVRALRLGGPSALHLWWAFIAYCKQQQSDGRVPADMIATVDGPPKRWRPRALEALVTVKLVEHDGADLLVHDYLDWNESREEISVKSAARKAARQRTPAAPPTTGDSRSYVDPSVVPSVVPTSIRAQGEPKNNGHLIPLCTTPSSYSPSYSSDPDPPFIPPSPSAPANDGPEKKSSTRRGSRLCPADFTPNPKTLSLANELGFSESLERVQRDRMIDWSRSKSKARSDWQATYRNWLRKEAEDRGLKPVKHDAQWEYHQAMLRKANAPVKNPAPPPPGLEAKIGSLFS